MQSSKLQLGSAALIVLGLAQPAMAQPTITGGPTPCVAPGRFPRIEVVIESAGEVSEARVVFRGDRSPSWHAVDLLPSGNAWTASLPAPDRSLKTLSYFITATDQGGPSRFPMRTALVVTATGTCTEGQAVADSGPTTLHVASGPTLELAGFDKDATRAFIEDSFSPTPDAALLPQQQALRVRVSARDTGRTPLIGTLTAWDQSRLVIRLEGHTRPLVLDRSDVFALEVSEGASWSRGKAAATGAGIGLGCAAVIGVGVGLANANSEYGVLGPAMMVTMILGPPFVGLGAILGAVAPPDEKWRAAPEFAAPRRTLSLGLQPVRRGAALSLQASF